MTDNAPELRGCPVDNGSYYDIHHCCVQAKRFAEQTGETMYVVAVGSGYCFQATPTEIAIEIMRP